MKYAFIALIACYLLVYGCGPDNSKKTEAKKEQAVHSTIEKPAPPAQATPPPETAKQPVAAAVDAPPRPAQQGATTAPPPQPMAEEQKTGEATQGRQAPCPMMVHQQGAVELTQPDEENIVVMPCGCMFIKHPMPANVPYLKDAPCVKQQAPPCPMMDEKQPATEDGLIMMPCGRVFVRQPMPVDGPDLDRPMQMEPPCQGQVEPQVMEEPEEDLAGAVQKMAEATNDMMLVTRQLVVATQEMLKATKGGASEDANTNQQSSTADVKNKTADKEQEAVNAMKDAVIATQKAIDAMSQIVPKTVDQRQ